MPADPEDVAQWEKAAACCWSWGFVWYKRGCGSDCGINCLLSICCGACCCNICHACKFVGEEPEPTAPAAGSGVIHRQPLWRALLPFMRWPHLGDLIEVTSLRSLSAFITNYKGILIKYCPNDLNVQYKSLLNIRDYIFEFLAIHTPQKAQGTISWVK